MVLIAERLLVVGTRLHHQADPRDVPQHGRDGAGRLLVAHQVLDRAGQRGVAPCGQPRIHARLDVQELAGHEPDALRVPDLNLNAG